MPDIKKVLIIDDEIDLCLLLKDYFFRKKNYEVIVSHTLGEGKSLLDKIRPDVLFLDNNLPDGLGWVSAPGISKDFPEMVIVLISAFHPSVPDMPKEAKFYVIEKPISLADLDKQFVH